MKGLPYLAECLQVINFLPKSPKVSQNLPHRIERRDRKKRQIYNEEHEEHEELIPPCVTFNLINYRGTDNINNYLNTKYDSRDHVPYVPYVPFRVGGGDRVTPNSTSPYILYLYNSLCISLSPRHPMTA